MAQEIKQYLRTSEVATLLGCSKQYVVRLIRDKRLESHQLGAHGWHRISLKSLRQYAGGERIALDFSLLNHNAPHSLDDSTA